MGGVAAFGIVVQYGTTTGTATSQTLANVTNVSGLDSDVEEIDVTSHDSAGAYREKVASFIDAGEVQVDLNFDPNNTTHRATSPGILWLRDQRLTVPWVIKFAGTPTHQVRFNAFVRSAPFDGSFDDKLSMTATLSVSGSATWTYGT